MTPTLALDDASADPHTRRLLSDISLSIARAKKIVVVTGAGISCSCGIPDFRSSDGLYALVKEKYPDTVLKGRDLFDASLFRDATSTAVFYTFISQLKRSIDAAEPGSTHHFIKTLDAKKKLLRSYTQNIDGLEARVGLLGTSCEEAKSNNKGRAKLRTREVRNVQLHGDIHRVRCVSCSAEYPCSEEYLMVFEKGRAPQCPECISRAEARIARSARAIRIGSLRPGIVLYDEAHPLGDDIGAIHSADLSRKPDMLIIMGTSLKVHGCKKLVKDFAKVIHSSRSASSSSKKPCQVIFVNKTPPGTEWSDVIDYHVAGETDKWAEKVIEDWKKMRPADWEIQQTLSGSEVEASLTSFKVIKSLAPLAPKNGKEERENNPNRLAIPKGKGAKPSGNPEPPLSPSKRRQKSCHYDDVNSSPSKRHSTVEQISAMPREERKMLFAEATNRKTTSDSDKGEVSLCDFSMQSMDGETKSQPFSVNRTSQGTKETSKMDISILDLSMRDGDSTQDTKLGTLNKAKPPDKPRRTRRKRMQKGAQIAH